MKQGLIIRILIAATISYVAGLLIIVVLGQNEEILSALFASIISIFIGAVAGGLYIFGNMPHARKIIFTALISLVSPAIAVALYLPVFNALDNYFFSHNLTHFITNLIVFGWLLIYLVQSNQKTKRVARAGYTAIAMGLFSMIVLGMLMNRYQLNPDGISYFAIAEHYAAFEFRNAINAYWSPLFSWILVPFLWVGISAEIAYRIVLIATIITILLVQHLMQNIFLRNSNSNLHLEKLTALSVSAFGLFVFSAMGPITPDTLVVLWVLIYAILLHKLFTEPNVSRAIVFIIGTVGAVGFYVKGFLLPFFLVTLTLLMVTKISMDRKQLKHNLITAGIIIAITAILIAPWVILLKIKYGSWSIGSSSSYNISFVGPESLQHTINGGLVPPPHEKAYNAWEDPTEHKYIKWSPLWSFYDTSYHAFVNAPSTYKSIVASISQWSPLLFLSILAGPILLGIARLRSVIFSDSTHSGLIVVSLISIVYLAGYIAAHMVGGDRYIMPVFFVGTIGLLVITAIIKSSFVFKRNTVFNLMSLMFIAVFLYTYILPATMDKHYLSKKEKTIADWSNVIAGIIPARSKIASNSTSYQFSYLSNLITYGRIPPGTSYEEKWVKQSIALYDIEYFICYNDQDSKCGFGNIEPHFRASKADENLIIYKITNNN